MCMRYQIHRFQIPTHYEDLSIFILFLILFFFSREIFFFFPWKWDLYTDIMVWHSILSIKRNPIDMKILVEFLKFRLLQIELFRV